MSDENLDIKEDEILDTLEEDQQSDEAVEQAEPPVVDKETELARSNGHVSKEEWIQQGRDPDEWVSAKKFNEKARMIAKLNRYERDIENIKRYNELQQKQMREKALEDARLELLQAKEDEDFEAYEQANKRYAKAEQDLTVIQQQEVVEAEQEFIERNKHWFDANDNAQQQELRALIPDIVDDYPNLSVRERMLKLERRFLDNHPEYKSPQRNASDRPVVNGAASAVNKSAMVSSTASKSFNALPEKFKSDYFSLQKSLKSQMGIDYTKEEFIQGLKDMGEI
jgi:hypothetical protein